MKINPDKRRAHQKLAQGWNVKGYPTTIIMDVTGKTIARVAGYVPPNRFIGALDSAANPK